MSVLPQGSNSNTMPGLNKEASPGATPPADKDGRKVAPEELPPQVDPAQEGQQERKAANDK